MFPFDPLKVSENIWFSDVFRWTKRQHWKEMGLANSNIYSQFKCMLKDNYKKLEEIPYMLFKCPYC